MSLQNNSNLKRYVLCIGHEVNSTKVVWVGIMGTPAL